MPTIALAVGDCMQCQAAAYVEMVTSSQPTPPISLTEQQRPVGTKELHSKLRQVGNGWFSLDGNNSLLYKPANDWIPCLVHPLCSAHPGYIYPNS